MGLLKQILLSLIFGVVSYVTFEFMKTETLPSIDPNPWWKKGEPGEDRTDIIKFFVKVPEKDQEDLKNRLDLPLKLTPPLEQANFTYGFNTKTMQTIVEYWKTEYNWKQRQEKLNSLPQYKTQIEGLVIHFLRVKPRNVPEGMEVRPLLLIHGWPGSIVEFYDIISFLTTPQKNSKVVFEVIAPSLPGFGFSEGAEKPGLGVLHISQIFYKLMKRMNFDKFYVQGGDWGSIITRTMANMYQDEILGAHTNAFIMRGTWVNLKYFLGSILPSGWIMEPSKEEQFYPIQPLLKLMGQETGYFHIQATKPDTIGIALNQSPVGLAAYILEKFSTGTQFDNPSREDGGLLTNFPMSLDALLDNIHVYWFTHSITTSIRIYSEFMAEASLPYDNLLSKVPYGVSSFRYEIMVFPSNFVRAVFPNLLLYKQHDACGHFAAMECPDLLAQDIYTFVTAAETYRSS